jgi:hypothetical protein
MAIRGNLSTGVQPLGATDADVVVHVDMVNRTAITAFVIHNNDGNNLTVEIYESTNDTSASGERVAEYALASDESVDIIECLGQGYPAGIRVICKITTAAVSAGDMNARVTYTEYSGGS